MRAELRLARGSSEPLAHLPLSPDPLQSFAAVIASLDPGHGEQAEIAIDLLPRSPGPAGACAAAAARGLPPRRARRTARQVRRGAGLPRAVGQVGASRAEIVGESAAREALAAKAAEAEPLFARRSWSAAAHRRRPGHDRLQGCSAASTACRRELAARRRRAPARARVPGSDLPGRRAGLTGGWTPACFAPPGKVWSPPGRSRGCSSHRPFAARHRTCCASARPSIPRQATSPTSPGRPTAAAGPGQGERASGASVCALEDTFFTYIAGRSRWGKTELAITQFLHLVRTGHGGLFLDPHEDAIARIKSCLTEPELAARVIELDLVGARSREGQPGWNLLAARGLSGEQRSAGSRRSSTLRLRAAVGRAQQPRAHAHDPRHRRADRARRGPARRSAPTIFQISTLLGNPEWREAVLPFLSPCPPRVLHRALPAALRRGDHPCHEPDRPAALLHPARRAARRQQHYDIAQAMNEGRIVLACPGAGGARDKLVANLLVFDLLHAAKGRATSRPSSAAVLRVRSTRSRPTTARPTGISPRCLSRPRSTGYAGSCATRTPSGSPRDAERAHHQPLTPDRHRAERARSRADRARVGRRPPQRDHRACRATRSSRRSPTRRADHPSCSEPHRQRALPRRLSLRRHRDQPIIDDVSGRADAAETISALDTLDQRIREHLPQSGR